MQVASRELACPGRQGQWLCAAERSPPALDASPRAQRTVDLLVVGQLAGKEKAVEKLIVGPPAGFAGPLSHKAFQQETITAKPGIYVEVCFMDTQDNRQHTQLGIKRIIQILK